MRLPDEFTKKKWAIVDENGKIVDTFKHQNSAISLRVFYNKNRIFKLKVVRLDENEKVSSE